VARRLGVAYPAPLLGPLLKRTFGRPQGDPAYAMNTLAPGAVPLELSFSERDPAALRLDVEPFERLLSPMKRRAETVEVTAATLRSCFGAEAAESLTRATAPWMVPGVHVQRFGAFYGAAFDPRGLAESTIYLELPRDSGWVLPGSGSDLLKTVRKHLPSAALLMHAISYGWTGLAERTSLVCLDELRLLDLALLLGDSGPPHRVPVLLDTALALSRGFFVLPAGTVVLGLRASAAGIEVKLELLVAYQPTDVRDVVEQPLTARPDSAAAFQRWLMVVGEGGQDATTRLGTINVVSARVGPEDGVKLNGYVRPAALAWLCGLGVVA